MPSSNQSYSLIDKAQAEYELRKRRQKRRQAVANMTPEQFLGYTKIEQPTTTIDQSLVRFELWPSQIDVLRSMTNERLLLFLKARQLGITWLACGYSLYSCIVQSNQTILIFSQGQREADELIRRIGVLYAHHELKSDLPRIIRNNVSSIVFDNGSRVLSLPATKRAGRSFTASVVILDEWAFHLWGAEMLSAVKPTIDSGGKLFIVSTADGPGTIYHQLCLAAESGSNGYRFLFLPWYARPDRHASWRDEKLAESGGDIASIKREYPENALEAFTNAAGLVYELWSDGPNDGNVTADADYIPEGGALYWAIDDGYAGKFDSSIGAYTADSHPRVFLLAQLRSDGSLCIFGEHYACHTLSENHINTVISLGYPEPEYAAVDKSAAELKGRLSEIGIYTRNSPSNVSESIKELQRMLAKDENGRRRIRIHPRCTLLRGEMAKYRQDSKNQPVKEHDHGPDALRYLAWTMRYE
jgi:hypothetical protein